MHFFIQPGKQLWATRCSGKPKEQVGELSAAALEQFLG